MRESSGSRALFLSPEQPGLGQGGGPLRSASLLAYLERRYEVDVVRFDLREHSRSPLARVSRNVGRLLRGRPPLFDRYAGYEDQLTAQMLGRLYDVAVIEHFWCASYADLLRPSCGRLVLDLHNIESALAASHAEATGGARGALQARFAAMYRDLERQWLPRFDTVLTASELDRERVIEISAHADVRVFQNAIPVVALPADIAQQEMILFTGNLEYHPNLDAVRWFRKQVWPLVREQAPGIEWRLAGRNAQAVEPLAAGDARIRVTGSMDDAVRTLAEAKVCVVPLRSGSGTRFKILEAWAAGRAVVSTSLGAEGLGALHGEHLLIADTAEEFAGAVLRLLNDGEARAKLGAAGRRLYEDRFTWDAAWAALDEAGGL